MKKENKKLLGQVVLALSIVGGTWFICSQKMLLESKEEHKKLETHLMAYENMLSESYEEYNMLYEAYESLNVELKNMEDSLAEAWESSHDFQARRRLLLDVVKENDQSFDDWDAYTFFVSITKRVYNAELSTEAHDHCIEILRDRMNEICEGYKNGEDSVWLKYRTLSVVETINWHLEDFGENPIHEDLELEELNRQIYGEFYETASSR